MRKTDTIVVLDFGGQYAHLIANRVRRLNAYSEIKQPDVDIGEIEGAKGLILSGGPASVYDVGQPPYTPEIFELGIPILGLCYGHQLMCQHFGGKVIPGSSREYGVAHLRIVSHQEFLKGMASEEEVWMSHGDTVECLPQGFENLAYTEDCPAAAIGDPTRKLFGLQFHPEVTHTPNGMKILENFVELCGCARDWTMESYIEAVLSQIKTSAGDGKVFLLVSGGVDSTVAFVLLNRALGTERVYGLHIDNGFMRKDESRSVEQALGEMGFQNFHVVDASPAFLDAVCGVTAPEAKRKVIGEQFIRIKNECIDELHLNTDEWMLGQGTIYPDTIETGGTAYAAVIKTHHNRVEPIQRLIEEGKVIEPLAQLYKDEVREVGLKLGLPESLVWRHPFPGPGLALRALCTDGKERIDVLQETERHVCEMADAYHLEARLWPIKTVGVQGDFRTYAHPVMLSGKAHWDDLGELSTRITNRFREINRVVYLVAPEGLPVLSVKPCYLTRARLDLLREADAIAMDAIYEYGLAREIWQMPIILVPLSSNGKKELVVLRPVLSTEAMTARFARIPMDIVRDIVQRILAFEGIEGVLYDITHKPPGTIEWE